MKKIDEEFEKCLISLNKEELCNVLRDVVSEYKKQAHYYIDDKKREYIAIGLCTAESYIYTALDIPSDIRQEYFDNYWNKE